MLMGSFFVVFVGRKEDDPVTTWVSEGPNLVAGSPKTHVPGCPTYEKAITYNMSV